MKMTKNDRIAIVVSSLYLLISFIASGGEGFETLILSTPLVAYWGYRFIKGDISFIKSTGKDQIIELAIEALGREGSAVGTAYKEISFADVAAYMRGQNCNVLDSIKDPANGWVDFEAIVKGQKYVVTLSRTVEGGGSVLTSAKA